MRITTRRQRRRRIHARIRQKISGTAGRPRLAVYRSLKHIYAQVIDDAAGRTLVAAGSRETGSEGGGTAQGAALVGEKLADGLYHAAHVRDVDAAVKFDSTVEISLISSSSRAS